MTVEYWGGPLDGEPGPEPSEAAADGMRTVPDNVKGLGGCYVLTTYPDRAHGGPWKAARRVWAWWAR